MSLGAIGLLLTGCSQEEAPISPAQELTAVWQTVPPDLVFQADAFYLVQVRVSESDAEVDSVRATIENADGQPVAQFRLYDDAGAGALEDALDFASASSGDLTAGNGVFTRRINSLFAAESGEFHLRVTAWANDRSTTTPADTIVVFPSQPPQIADLNLPDSLLSGFASVQVSLVATDPDAPQNDSITVVEMRLYAPGGAQLGNPIPLEYLGGAAYGTTLTAAFAAEHPSGNYTFAFRAWDRYGVPSDSQGVELFMENLAPHLADPAYIHTVQRPSPGAGDLEVPLTIRCWDDQTTSDLSTVHLLSRKPDGSFANNELPIPMADNGLEFDPLRWDDGYWGDLTAGDSVFTTTAVLYDTSQTGTYIFTFGADDLAGNSAAALVDSLIVLP